MFRVIALLAGISAVLAPTVLAQNASLCVFQQKQGHSPDVDGGFDSSLLSKELGTRIPASLGLDLIPISGFTGKEIEGEAQRRNCTWVVTLWREQLGPDSPNFAGTLGGTQSSNSQGVNIMVKGTKIGGNTLLEFSLRKADAHKPVAHGEGEEESTYGKFADTIVKKIQKEK
jgi:hypothetical protein